MIEVAKERLDKARLLSERIEFHVAAFEELELPVEAYDLITSNMALHHMDEKWQFYASMRAALPPDGVLVFGDELRGATPEIEQRHVEGCKEFARRPGHLTQAEFDDIDKHIEQFDHYETLPKQLELLAWAGFSRVDSTWRYLNYGVFVAVP